MKTIAEFEALYEKDLKPQLEPLETMRKGFMKKVLIVLFSTIAAIALVFVAGKAGWIQPANMEANVLMYIIMGGAFVAGLVVFIIVFYLFKKKFTARFKSEIIDKMVKFVDNGLYYSAQSGISESVYMQSSIFLTRPDRYKTEDRVSGTIDKTAIEFAEIHSEYKTTNGKNTQWHTIFKGLFFIADFNKNFGSRTVVLPDNFGKTFAFIGNALQKMNVMRDSLVKLEDPEFEKHFVVYGKDQVEARYILSTSLMARILDFKNKTNARISLAFLDNKLFLALPLNKDLFEPNIFSSVMKFELLKEYFQYIILTVGIVEDLNLNTRIWTKD
ncbi:MAG: DUF3137 domain-containing protein [Bacteroidota bacterium]